MPKTLFVDFTHQLIDRDYMFQSFIEGERWEDVVGELSAAENDMLWEQFGKLLKKIHDVRGEAFGMSLPGFQFRRWSHTVIDHMEHTLKLTKNNQIEVPNLAHIMEVVRVHPERLDEIQVPRLLHGDLWLFNLLINRGKNGPSIVGILDADRAWWGDPMADWTMFILAHAEKVEGHSRFWQAYGQPEDTAGTRFRAAVYDAMYAGRAFVWAVDHQDAETVERAKGTLSEVTETLPALL